MTSTEKSNKIVAAIAARGWFTAELYPVEANELRKSGLIKLATKRTSVGGSKFVWVKACNW